MEKRFRITEESMQWMKIFRNELVEIQREMPQVLGFAYFGSRVVGKERAGVSDLDMIVLYDGEEFEIPILMDPDNIDIRSEEYRRYMEKYNKAESARKLLEGNIYNACKRIMSDNEFPNGSIIVEDVSRSATIKKLKVFMNYIGELEHVNEQAIIDNRWLEPIICRFLLSVGEGVYKSRAYVLDYLEELGEKGEFYFRAMMDCLRKVPRPEDRGSYQLPKTISEAREYFL